MDFRQNVEATIPSLRRYARALARDSDVADDLVQDTLVRALRSERLFLGGDLRSWLRSAAEVSPVHTTERISIGGRPSAASSAAMPSSG